MLSSTITTAATAEGLHDEVKALLVDILQLSNCGEHLTADTPLLGNFPELDSMAVVTVIAALEEHFGIQVDDDDDLAGAFESLGSLVDYVNSKTQQQGLSVA